MVAIGTFVAVRVWFLETWRRRWLEGGGCSDSGSDRASRPCSPSDGPRSSHVEYRLYVYTGRRGIVLISCCDAL